MGNGFELWPRYRHGVGFFLNVHEGPQSISPGVGTASKTIIEPECLSQMSLRFTGKENMGSELENLILCYEAEVNDYGQFLKFDTVSLCI